MKPDIGRMCREYGIPRTTFYQRRRAGLSVQEALTRPLRMTSRSAPTTPDAPAISQLLRRWRYPIPTFHGEQGQTP